MREHSVAHLSDVYSVEVVVILYAPTVFHVNSIEEASKLFLVYNLCDIEVLQNFVSHYWHNVFSTQQPLTIENVELDFLERCKNLCMSRDLLP